jgi:uncharacterized membrane protein
MDLYSAAVQINGQNVLIVITSMIIVFGFLYALFSFFGDAINPSPKSAKARKLMTDLYVIGMIRKFAKEDGVDVEAEMKGLRQIEKWEKMKNKDFDNQVEEELKEKISAKQQKEIEKINTTSK